MRLARGLETRRYEEYNSGRPQETDARKETVVSKSTSDPRPAIDGCLAASSPFVRTSADFESCCYKVATVTKLFTSLVYFVCFNRRICLQNRGNRIKCSLSKYKQSSA